MSRTTTAHGTITRKHSAIIHVAKKYLALSDEEYRALLANAAGITSTKDMHTPTQFRAIMDECTARGFPRNKKQTALPSQPDDRWGCSIKQRRCIHALWKTRARNTSTQALHAFIERMEHVEHPRSLSIEGASRVILALKKL